MLTPVVKSVIHTETIVKEVVFSTGVSCNYTLVNGNLTNYTFTSKKGKNLNSYIPDLLLPLYVQVPWHLTHKKFTSTELDSVFKTEEQLLNFQGTSDLYSRRETVLYDQEGNNIPLAIFLGHSVCFHYHLDKNDKKTMQLFIDFISKLDCVNVLENLEIDRIPYYNCDNEKNYEQYFVSNGLIAVDYDLYVKMLRPSSHDSSYLCNTGIANSLCDLFLEKYPENAFKE